MRVFNLTFSGPINIYCLDSTLYCKRARDCTYKCTREKYGKNKILFFNAFLDLKQPYISIVIGLKLIHSKFFDYVLVFIVHNSCNTLIYQSLLILIR